MTPEDFTIQSKFGVGQDWPISYAELQDCYSNAEYEMGVAADVEEQQYLGIKFDDGYVFSMHSLPPSYFDQQLVKKIDGDKINYEGHDYEMKVIRIPVGRNSMPNKQYNYQGRNGYKPVGSTGNPNIGLRCEGNSSCTPICPVQAKYNALKTLDKATKRGGVRIVTQSVASTILFDDEHKKVTGIHCKEYGNDTIPAYTDVVYTGKVLYHCCKCYRNSQVDAGL